MSVRINHANRDCLELGHFPEENVGYAKVGCVALTLLFLGAGIAVLSQQVILVPKLKFIMGGYLMGLSLFPAATFAVLQYCKKTEEGALIKKITPVHSKLYEQMITLQPNRVSIEEQRHLLLHIPEEIWNLIYIWCEPDVTRSCLSRLSVSFFKRFCFNPPELKAMGWYLGQLGRGNRTESFLKERTFKSYFTKFTRYIKSIQVVEKNIYLLEDHTYVDSLSALMVWNMETEAFTTHNLLELHSKISSFQIDGDLLYIMHKPVDLLPFLTIDSEGICSAVDLNKPWRFSIWNLKTRALVKEFPRDTGSHFKCYEFLCIMQEREQVIIYNKRDFTLLHTLEGVHNCVLNNHTLFF